MKKIGILTFHRALNYGAVLQAYALQHAIQCLPNCGYVSIIDYRCKRIENWFHSKSILSKLKTIYRFLFHHKYYKEIKQKENMFNVFIDKHLVLSKKCNSWKDFYNKYDEIIVGSDQVWNLEMTHNDINYLLPYNNGADKLSYAASFGKNEFSNNQNRIINKYVSLFSSVLLREDAGINYIKQLGIKGTKVIDPTLLLTNESWAGLCEPCSIEKPYILLYLVAKDTFSLSLAKKIAFENGWDVIYLDPPRFNYKEIVRMKNVGPSHFLWLVKNAKLVVTTSYHGLLFSLNFNTPFLYELSHEDNNTNSRLEDVVKTYELYDYEIQSNDADFYYSVSYDWNRINQKIEEARAASMEAIIGSLGLS